MDKTFSTYKTDSIHGFFIISSIVTEAAITDAFKNFLHANAETVQPLVTKLDGWLIDNQKLTCQKPFFRSVLRKNHFCKDCKKFKNAVWTSC